VAEEMQSCQAPIQAVQTKMLGEPVLQLVFPLPTGSARDLVKPTGRCAGCRQTHCVEALDIADVLFDIQPHLTWHVVDAPATRSRDEGHGNGTLMLTMQVRLRKVA
jgi:hypothetical protein